MKTTEIQKLEKAEKLILEVRNQYKGFGEFGSYGRIASDISEHIQILRNEN